MKGATQIVQDENGNYFIGEDEIVPPPGVAVLYVGEDDPILFLDLDGEEAIRTFVSRLGDLEASVKVTRVYLYPSLGGNLHAIIHLHPQTVMSKDYRAALQLYLGSDPQREWLYLHQPNAACVLFYPYEWHERVYGEGALVNYTVEVPECEPF